MRKNCWQNLPDPTGSAILFLIQNPDRFDHRLCFRRDRTVVIDRLSVSSDLVRNVLALRNVTKSSILTVKECRVSYSNEEL